MLIELSGSLRDLAVSASQSIPGCDGAGVTLIQAGESIFQSSNGFSRAVDQAQYGLGEGPCIDAVDHGCTVRSGTLGAGEVRWPGFTARTAEFQVRSVLSIPLFLADTVMGSINAYSRSSHAFSDEAVTVGELLARPIASSLTATHLVDRMHDVAASVGHRLNDRALVETAVGYLMAASHLSAPAARRQLADRAVSSHTTLQDIASQIIAEALGDIRT